VVVPFAVLPIPRKWFHRVADWVKYFWFTLLCVLLEHWCGTKIVLSGDSGPFERTLIISNHRTRLDWMYMWCFCLRTGLLKSLRIVSKSEMRTIPVLGWGMQSFMFLFLERKWDLDQRYLATVFPYLRSLELPSTVLVFPEGTDLSKERLEKSHSFAREHGLPLHNYVLYPRVKGLHFMLNELRHSLDSVLDITLGYVDYAPGERPNEKSLSTGRYPKAVHFHATKIPIGDIPRDEAGVEKWLHERFALKEERLKAFYERNQPFPNEIKPQWDQLPVMVATLLGWAVVTLLCVYVLWLFSWCRWMFLVMVAGWFAVSASGGLDVWELRLCAKGAAATQ